ncbi:MAG: GMC oxidoreductase [Acidimicrobiales bacterium]
MGRSDQNVSWAALAAAVDTVVPIDEWPAGWEGGVAALVELEPGIVTPMLDAVRPLLAALEAEAGRTVGGAAFAELTVERRQAVFDAVAGAGDQVVGLAALVQLSLQGFYASARHGEPAGLGMIGFRGVPEGVRAVEPEPLRTVAPQRLAPHYDYVVVGAGAGGGVTAGVLAEGGARVLLLERAPAHANDDLRGDHFRGKRAALTQVTASPGPGHPRVIVQPDGSPLEVPSADHEMWGHNAMAVGGGTRVWQGMAWRFFPEDFAMASTYGAPEGSTLADWPFDYDELAPYYERAEWEIGVAGEEGSLTARTPRHRGYPMPPLPGGRLREVYAAAADRLGWRWGPIPFALNSVPRFGRAACVACPQCVGHACPVDAKNGTHNTLIPRALATGTCDLAVSAQAVEIQHTAGRASGVRVVFDAPEGPHEQVVSCDHVVVTSGAVETPRLLLVSDLGNEWVGANLHSHGGGMALGLGPEPIQRLTGPGHNIATLDFVHRDGEAWGGGVLFDALPMLPVVIAQLTPLFGVAVGGADHKRWMREGLPHVLGAMGIGQEVPSARSRVSADPRVRDRLGMPVARLQGDTHPATREVDVFLAARGKQWLDEIGCDARALHRPDTMAAPAAGEHSAGTCRMGHDPKHSACDPFGRVHGTENVYVADASLHPTNGSVNPALTVMANAYRVAEGLLAL